MWKYIIAIALCTAGVWLVTAFVTLDIMWPASVDAFDRFIAATVWGVACILAVVAAAKY